MEDDGGREDRTGRSERNRNITNKGSEFTLENCYSHQRSKKRSKESPVNASRNMKNFLCLKIKLSPMKKKFKRETNTSRIYIKQSVEDWFTVLYWIAVQLLSAQV